MKKEFQLATQDGNGHAKPILYTMKSSLELFDLLMRQTEPIYNLWFNGSAGWFYVLGSPKAWEEQQPYINRNDGYVHKYPAEGEELIIDQSRTHSPDYLEQLAVAAWEAITEYELTHTSK